MGKNFHQLSNFDSVGTMVGRAMSKKILEFLITELLPQTPFKSQAMTFLRIYGRLQILVHSLQCTELYRPNICDFYSSAICLTGIFQHLNS